MIRFFRQILTFILIATACPIQAQMLHGYVTDAQTKDTLMFPSIVYKGHQLAVSGNMQGYYSIKKQEGWYLTFSAVGYESKTVLIKDNMPGKLDIALKPADNNLAAVNITAKKTKYSKKNNPAVELMRRVIAAKKVSDLHRHDYLQYDKYQKITLALNDIKLTDLDTGFFARKPWLKEHIELNPYNKKLTLPISVDETVTQYLYRKNPKQEKNIILGQNSTGINQLIQTGDILNTALKDVFTDVNIYDDYVRLLQFPFPSPIGKTAISFYRFYIQDTVVVDQDLCYHLQFIPANQQDFGFRGDIYILADSSLHVKRCDMTLPKRSDVNFVNNLEISQTFSRLSNGDWALTSDDMIVELSISKYLSKALVTRITRLNDYSFSPINKRLFKGKAKTKREANAMMRDNTFWAQYRGVELTKGETGMGDLIQKIQKIKGFKYIIFGVKALIENFVETGNATHPSKVDIGPVNTFITRNFIDGFRNRISAQTTANMSKHWFVAGYYAHGWSSKKNYYKAELTYSFNKKDYLPREFPKRNISFTSTYDIISPSDKFMPTDKDNVFTAFKWRKVDKMMFYNRQQLLFDWETENGLAVQLSLKTEENEAAGRMVFRSMADAEQDGINYNKWLQELPDKEVGKYIHNGKIRTTDLSVRLEFSPGRTYINTKQRRSPINLEAPVFTISHTTGLKGFVGGQYNYNLTEASIFKRFWLGTWGKVDTYIKAGAQWNQVPYPLLIMPAANLSYIVEDNMFSLINNMEFLNDRYATANINWDLNGKLFNRIPLIKKLKWRESLGVKVLWGTLTDKNNPFLASHTRSEILMPFPIGSNIMDATTPYVEMSAGIHNIFKLIHIEYVRRLTYTNLPTAQKDGIRFMIRITF